MLSTPVQSRRARLPRHRYRRTSGRNTAPASRDVDVAVVSWNSWPALQESLPALLSQRYAPYRVVLVDNDSHDHTTAEVAENFPEVHLIRSGANRGYGAASNIGFTASRSRYVAVLNPDTRPEPGWLEELVAALHSHPEAALATSKVLLRSDPRRVNACGNTVHISGITTCRGLMQDERSYVRVEETPAISGAAFLARREILDEIGGFDERFFMYLEDTELSLRARLAGHTIVLAPASRVVHDWELTVPAWKFYYLERNRYLLLLNMYRWRTLVALVPALLLAEAGVWAYALRSGPAYVWAKLRGYASVLAGLRLHLRRRAQVQAVRRVPDSRLLSVLSNELQVGPDVLSPRLTGLVNRLFRLYGRLLRAVVQW